MSRRSSILAALVGFFAVGLLAAPLSADHHEAAEPSETETPAEAFRRLVDVDGASETAPDEFRVEFDTTKGKIVLEVHREWSPHGVDRFYSLVRVGYYDDVAFFRVIDGFMAQFGMHGDPKVTRRWQRASITDDPVKESNKRGYVTFAKTGRPHSRTTQLFINLKDNVGLDRQGFSPFARVVEGMDVVDQIYKVGEGAPRGRGPSQQQIQRRGNDYLKKNFKELDYLVRASIVE